MAKKSKFFTYEERKLEVLKRHNKAIPEELTKAVKKGFKARVVDNIPVVKSMGTHTSFTIFHLQETANKFGLEYDDILVVLYLQELVFFKTGIKVLDRGIALSVYIRLGLVEEEMKYDRKGYYKLSKLGNEVANFFNQASNNDKYLNSNREVEVDDIDFNVKSALSGFFD